MKNLLRLCGLFVVILATPALAQGDDGWKRADSAHFSVFSDGSAEELVEYTRTLEKFDGLLRFWFDKPSRDDDQRLSVYLLEDQRAVGDLFGKRRVAGFYKAGPEAVYAVAHREGGAFNGQTVLFHEYAHHFMFREFNVPAPAWLTEGFAEFLGTVQFADDGRWTYGALAEHRSGELRRWDDLEIQKLLAWPQESRGGYVIPGFYGWSWALTHMLYMDEDRGARIGAYLDRLSAGEQPLPAAEAVFGDLERLERRLESYVRNEMDFAISDEPFPWDRTVELSMLEAEAGRMLELRLRRMTGHEPDEIRDDLLAYAAGSASPAQALAEAGMAAFDVEAGERYEFKEKNDRAMAGPYFPEAAQLADRALAADPENVRANLLKGRILARQLKESRSTDADAWTEARRHFQMANRSDPGNAEALFGFARSYVWEGREGKMMGDAFLAAFRRAPQVRLFRIGLAYDLARQGQYDSAIALVQPIANDPHYPKGGRKIVERIEAMRASGAKFPELDYDDEYDGDEDSED